MVVQSGHSGGPLNAIPGIDFSRYPQIMAAPPVPTPADYFALTRILVVPSVWEEPFGRVAAEAMINGIPALVSDRGSLPHVVGGDFSAGGGGRVLPIPDWMTDRTAALPSEAEIEPWFDAVCARCRAVWSGRAARARARTDVVQRRGFAQEAYRLLRFVESRRPASRESHREPTLASGGSK